MTNRKGERAMTRNLHLAAFAVLLTAATLSGCGGDAGTSAGDAH